MYTTTNNRFDIGNDHYLTLKYHRQSAKHTIQTFEYQTFIQLIFFDHKSQTMIFCVLFQDIPLPLQPQWNISWTYTRIRHFMCRREWISLS